MDEQTIIELAESEVFVSGDFDLNPAVRNFKSFFSDEISPRINDLQRALKFYKALSDKEIRRRYNIHFWEVCALGAFDSLHDDIWENFHRSIDKHELARREILNIDLLLNEGKYQIMPSNDFLLIEEIPVLYEKLISGTWSEYIVAEELESYELAREKESEIFRNQMFGHFEKYKEQTDESSKIWREMCDKHSEESPKYVDYFNRDWVAAMQIQALIWYKVAIENIMTNGAHYLTTLAQEPKKNIERTASIFMSRLRRTNDGHIAMITSFNNFFSKFQRKPQWTELIDYMYENPPDGINVSGKKKGNRVFELTIEGLEKPMDREAFKKRFERYFPKTDIKQDNK